MAQLEYEGIKMSGSKLLIIIPLLGTLIGGLWGGFVRSRSKTRST